MFPVKCFRLAQGPGTRDKGQGTRDKGPGTRARDKEPGTRDQGQGTRDKGQGPDQGTRARDQGPDQRQGPRAGTRDKDQIGPNRDQIKPKYKEMHIFSKMGMSEISRNVSLSEIKAHAGAS